MNGFEAIKVIKGMEESAETPVIAISAAASKHDIEVAMDAGFDAYLSKPINVGELLKALKANLGIE
jgi:CheY-like chemotaxis protein